MGRQLPSNWNDEEKISREWQLFVNSEDCKKCKCKQLDIQSIFSEYTTTIFSAMVEMCRKCDSFAHLVLPVHHHPCLLHTCHCPPTWFFFARKNFQMAVIWRILQPAEGLSFSSSHPGLNFCRLHLDIRTGWLGAWAVASWDCRLSEASSLSKLALRGRTGPHPPRHYTTHP